MRRFREAAEAMDVDTMIDCLDANVEFKSPAVHKAYRGKEIVGYLLRKVAGTFKDFRYISEFTQAGESALIFKARVGDFDLEGVDWIRTDTTTGKITHLTVFVRPFSGLQALATAMTPPSAGDQKSNP